MIQRIENFSEDDQKAVLIGLVEAANHDLEDVASASANRAFNLGFAIGILPACVIVVGTFILTRYSWVGSFVMLILMSLALVLTSNVIAAVARTNAMKRLFQESIRPQIQSQTLEFDLTEGQFASICYETLPPGSPLLQFYPPPMSAATEVDARSDNTEVGGEKRS